MNLLEDPWIPGRADNGAGAFQLLTYRQLLCEPGRDWQVSLLRDDLELACLQLLVCMTQVMFLPEDDAALRKRMVEPLTTEEFDAGIVPCRDWFDLNHPTHPFMQTRGCAQKTHGDSKAADWVAGRQQPCFLQRGWRNREALGSIGSSSALQSSLERKQHGGWIQGQSAGWNQSLSDAREHLCCGARLARDDMEERTDRI